MATVVAQDLSGYGWMDILCVYVKAIFSFDLWFPQKLRAKASLSLWALRES